jgi:prevent-host-death family protein
MAATETVDIEAFEAKFFNLLDCIERRELDRVTITRRGQPVAVLLPPEPPIDAVPDLFGTMRGSVTIAEGVDLTKPALNEPFTTEDIDPFPIQDSDRRA